MAAFVGKFPSTILPNWDTPPSRPKGTKIAENAVQNDRIVIRNQSVNTEIVCPKRILKYCV